MKKAILFIVILISNYFGLNANCSGSLVKEPFGHISIPIDSIFEKFVHPKVPEFLVEEAGDFNNFVAYDFFIFCFVEVDTNSMTRKIDITPINSIGNDLQDTSYIWKSIIKSIDSVSKLWKFKPIKYQKNDINYTSMFRTTKLQLHAFILQIHLPFSDLIEPDFLYWINIRPNQEE